jgi:hypothetical protein
VQTLIVVGNNLGKSSSLQLGAFSFDMKRGKKDEGKIIYTM